MRTTTAPSIAVPNIANAIALLELASGTAGDVAA
jgi:hypothetical protein